MRTIIAVFALSLTLCSVCAQQSSLYGVVTIFNSKFETGTSRYIANASIEENYGHSQATLTGTDGIFQLQLVGIGVGEKVIYSVKKTGYEVVNTDALQGVAGQTEPQRVFLAPEGKIGENKLKYYKINREAAEKALNEKLKRLENDIRATKSDAARKKSLQDEHERLQAQFDQIEEMARDLAERYARTNLDDASADYQRAFRCFERGKMDSALLIFKASNLEASAAKIISEQNRNAELAAEYARRNSEKNKLKEATNDALQFKAQLHQTRFEFDNAEVTYRLLLYLDSANVDNVWDFASFLARQNQHDSAIVYYKKCLSLAKSEELKATFLNNLGISNHRLNNLAEAERKYQEAFKIYMQLAKSNPTQFEIDFARTVNNFAIFYTQNNRFIEAEEKFLLALQIRKRLLTRDTSALSCRDLAITATSLGDLYQQTNRYREAYEEYLLAINILKQLIMLGTIQFEPDLAIAANNLGALYQLDNHFIEAEQNYKLALEIRKRLADVNPHRYEHDLAQTANNFGTLCLINNQFKEAKGYLQLAFDTYKRLIIDNPSQFEPDFAATANNLGELYRRDNLPFESEKYFMIAYEIRDRLAKSYPAQFESKLAETASNLGNVYNEVGRTIEAEQKYLMAIKLYESMVNTIPDCCESNLAETANNFAVFYFGNGKKEEAIDLCEKSLKIYRKLVTDNPVRFEIEIARTLLILGAIHSDGIDPSKGQSEMKEARLFASKYPDLPLAQQFLGIINEYLKD